MAEHPLCHRRVPQSFFPAIFFFWGFLFFFVKKKRKILDRERKKERKKEHKAVKKNADGHSGQIVFTTHGIASFIYLCARLLCYY